MAYTLNENGQPWEYMALLNQCINILVTTSLGAVLAYFRVFDAKTFVPNAVKFVLHVALPLHIVRGIGIVVDFYNPMFQWNYIVAFLALRVVGLAMSFGMVIVSALWKGDKRGIGDVVVLWLTLTWISTVILGVPILQAMFKSEPLALFYGLVSTDMLSWGFLQAISISFDIRILCIDHSLRQSPRLYSNYPFSCSSSSAISLNSSASKNEPGH